MWREYSGWATHQQGQGWSPACVLSRSSWVDRKKGKIEVKQNSRIAGHLVHASNSSTLKPKAGALQAWSQSGIHSMTLSPKENENGNNRWGCSSAVEQLPGMKRFWVLILSNANSSNKKIQNSRTNRMQFPVCLKKWSCGCEPWKHHSEHPVVPAEPGGLLRGLGGQTTRYTAWLALPSIHFLI